jgi:hypothetical protein
LFHLEHGEGIDPIAAVYWRRHDWRMAKSTTPDLFSNASDRELSSRSVLPASSATPAAAKDKVPRLVLPMDLPNAIKLLADQELDRLVAAALAEQQRRGRKPPVSDETTSKRRVEPVAVPLTQGKLKAVRAAFKAGISPSKIARQFGLSKSDVRKALASDTSKRTPHRD